MRASEFIKEETYQPPEISTGDEIKIGKFKNRKAIVKGFKTDNNGQPVLTTTKGDQKLFKPRISKLVKEEITDVSHYLEQTFYGGYNEYCKKNRLIIEGTAEGLEVQEFVQAYYVKPVIGSNYYLSTLMWPMMPGHTFLSIVNIGGQYKLKSILSDGRLEVKQLVTGAERTFPETCGPVIDKISCSALFATEKEKDDFLLMLTIRFAHWTRNMETKF
jgi:hypothetical protein